MISEIVIECETADRRGLFRRQRTPQRWSAHRNIWNIPQDEFQLKYVVTSMSGERTEYREFNGALFRQAPGMQWVLEDKVLCKEELFDSTVGAAQVFGIHDIYVFEEVVWKPANEPFYEITFSDASCPMIIASNGEPQSEAFTHEQLDDAVSAASSLSDGAEPVVFSRIEAVERFTALEPLPQIERPLRTSPLSPVAELVTVRWDEVVSLRDKLFSIVEEPTSPASDIVAQLSAVSVAIRRLLDDARTLNNDPNAP